MPAPEHETAPDERPAGAEQGDGASGGRSGERERRLVVRDGEREAAEQERDRPQRKPEHDESIVSHRLSGFVALPLAQDEGWPHAC